jgi:hypothetical protein
MVAVDRFVTLQARDATGSSHLAEVKPRRHRAAAGNVVSVGDADRVRQAGCSRDYTIA